MGNALPRRFKYNPVEYAEFKTTTKGGSLRSFLIWKLQIELNMKPFNGFETPVNYVLDMIPRLQMNQDEYHSAIFELFRDADTQIIYARLVKFPA